MQRQSPPKHRHDGTSPLPLGMDWSPPPRKWVRRHSGNLSSFDEVDSDLEVYGVDFRVMKEEREQWWRLERAECPAVGNTGVVLKLLLNGRDTVWPHDPRTGWSYCITIPSWAVLPKSRESDPVVRIPAKSIILRFKTLAQAPNRV
ncbi:hypothetical protein RJ640_018155 [Escallonia rubra]|uniref:Uncharacterized protein n=1 Tax=Escallonia rubra TaxID=112253 RepID=A0AA88R5C4_9ASTE|nr:hypothetical protein RJ640_018155 [Escallonia rubra]